MQKSKNLKTVASKNFKFISILMSIAANHHKNTNLSPSPRVTEYKDDPILFVPFF